MLRLLITTSRQTKVCLQLCSFQHINTKIFARKTYNRFIEQLIKSLQDFRDLADSSCVKQHTQDGAHEVCSILKTCNFFFSFEICFSNVLYNFRRTYKFDLMRSSDYFLTDTIIAFVNMCL